MKKFNKVSIFILAVMFTFGLTRLNVVHAATAPNLGVAAGYSVFGNAGITETPAQMSHLWGNTGGNGLGNLSLIASQVDGSIDAGANVPVVGAISSAYGDLAGEAQTGAIDLATSPTVVPGVYDVAATAFNSTLTLNGPGVYIFRSTSSIAQTAGGTMLLTSGACADDVFWQIPTSMTFAAPGNIEGTIITNTGLISFTSGVSLKGRAWAATQVTMDNNQITEPVVCPIAPTLVVNKIVVNDDRGNKLFSDFSLKLDGLAVIHGVVTTSTIGLHTVSEVVDSDYTSTIGGDCATDGTITLASGDIKTCTITNDDIHHSSSGSSGYYAIPPLIDVVKVPSPLALPAGPGAVTYTYTLRNIGTVPVTDITMVGDTCSPIVLTSGDTDADSKLDVTETWVYNCSTTLSKTHTNIVTATGWANGISTTDIASATVVVGASIVPPLIHITKVPSPLALTNGGVVTYNYTVTNPGTVPLSNVSVSDDKCTGLPGRVVGHPGDLNKNNLLESNESWSFTCKSNIYKTTTNTATASGSANGLTAKDFAIATVVVANPAPLLPKTGFISTSWNQVALIGLLMLISVSLILFLKKRKA